MASTTTLTLIDGVRIVVPDSLHLITPYVLQEQQDWFEDEIKFLRRLLRAGDQVIDIGANYGVYTLSMAKTVGPGGRVWAFEPASGTARLLAASLAANDFAHVLLEPSALSSETGTAQLSLHENSELNSLLHDQAGATASETVALVTLDQRLQSCGWRDIAFMKIDAEGEEAKILQGGARFFAELSPLVQYEVKAGAALHLELVRQFAALGYASYRLVPGLDMLVPFDAGATPDGYLLNLFCCKPDRAEQLAKQGFLLEASAGLRAAATDLTQTAKNTQAYGWQQTLAPLPYGVQLAEVWRQTMVAKSKAKLDTALRLYALSRDACQPAAARFNALETSFNLLQRLCKGQASGLRLASLARVATDYGARTLAVAALQQLGQTILSDKQVAVHEPFLAPLARFDAVAPGDALSTWVLAAVMEQIETLIAFSSFYSGHGARARVHYIVSLGFAGAEMARRLSLLQQRFEPLTAA